MRFRSEAGADRMIRRLFFAGLALAVSGMFFVTNEMLWGFALVAAGCLLATSPAWIGGPEDDSDETGHR